MPVKVPAPKDMGFEPSPPTTPVRRVANQQEILERLVAARAVCTEARCEVMLSPEEGQLHRAAAVEWAAEQLRDAGWSVTVKTFWGSGMTVIVQP